jgi:anti-sigma B factor antagonist
MHDESKNTTRLTPCVIDEHWRGTTVIIGCAGELDMNTTPELERRIALALKRSPTSMIVDLTDVGFLASHGMGVLVETHTLCSPAIGFAVVASGRATRRPMQLMGITDVISVHDTLADAVSALAT